MRANATGGKPSDKISVQRCMDVALAVPEGVGLPWLEKSQTVLHVKKIDRTKKLGIIGRFKI